MSLRRLNSIVSLRNLVSNAQRRKIYTAYSVAQPVAAKPALAGRKLSGQA